MLKLPNPFGKHGSESGGGPERSVQDDQPKQTIELDPLEQGIIETYGGADSTPFKSVLEKIAEAGIAEGNRDAVWDRIRESRSHHQSTQGIERNT